MTNNRHICGASIISPDYAITAAHCVSRSGTFSIEDFMDALNCKKADFPLKFLKQLNAVSLRAGTTNRNAGGTTHKATQIRVHGCYSGLAADYDIAVIKVSPPFGFGNGIQAIPLQDEGLEVPVGDMAVVSGWGTTASGGSNLPSNLLKVDVPVVDSNECNETYKSFGGITERMLCAGYRQGGKDSCQGDSGGPLVSNGKLIGVVSWGAGCADPEYPGVYSKISAFRPWIKAKTGL